MIKLQRTTEYALLALMYIAGKASKDAYAAASAREIAEVYQLPFDITAKMLQRLRDQGMIQSTQGVRGGYRLASDLSKIGLGKFITLLEGDQGLVGCVVKENQCEYQSGCALKPVLSQLHIRIMNFLDTVPIGEIIQSALATGDFNQTLKTLPILTEKEHAV